MHKAESDLRAQKIADDQALTHAVELVSGDVEDHEMASDISKAMKRIADRAVAAGMMILSTTISTNTTVVDGAVYLTVTMICHWASREMLEQQQRQAALMGMPGPRRAS